MSGDSDYIELVRHLKGEGVRVEIASVRKTTSGLLIDEADYFHDIRQEDWFTLSTGKSSPKRSKKKSKKKSAASDN
jgi:uncharacterized LabA/DUF88 family protein